MSTTAALSARPLQAATTPGRKVAVVTESVDINRPTDIVWAAIADYALDLQWRVGITEMTPTPAGPPRNGTHIHEVLRSAGMTFTTDAVVSDVEEGISYRFVGSGTTGDVSGLRLVEPLTSISSRFTYQVELRPTRHYRLLRRVLEGALASGLRKDLRRLKMLLEQSGEQ